MTEKELVEWETTARYYYVCSIAHSSDALITLKLAKWLLAQNGIDADKKQRFEILNKLYLENYNKTKALKQMTQIGLENSVEWIKQLYLALPDMEKLIPQDLSLRQYMEQSEQLTLDRLGCYQKDPDGNYRKGYTQIYTLPQPKGKGKEWMMYRRLGINQEFNEHVNGQTKFIDNKAMIFINPTGDNLTSTTYHEWLHLMLHELDEEKMKEYGQILSSLEEVMLRFNGPETLQRTEKILQFKQYDPSEQWEEYIIRILQRLYEMVKMGLLPKDTEDQCNQIAIQMNNKDNITQQVKLLTDMLNDHCKENKSLLQTDFQDLNMQQQSEVIPEIKPIPSTSKVDKSNSSSCWVGRQIVNTTGKLVDLVWTQY